MINLRDLPLSLLLDIGEWIPDRESLSAWIRTSRYFYTALNRHLYKLHIKHDKPSHSCLFWAAQVGRLDTFTLAHRLGADLDVTRPTRSSKVPPSPLHAAIQNLHPDIVRYIVHNGGAVHSPAWVQSMGRPYPLGKALHVRNLKQGASGVRKRQEILEILIRGGATLVDEQEPALPGAAAMNKKDIVSLLLQQPLVGVNDYTRRGYTALHMVSQNGHAELARYLLDQPGIDIYAEPPFGSDTALDMAVRGGHLDIVRQLLMWHGLHPDAAFELTKKAFAEALVGGQTRICEYLITLPDITGAMVLRDASTALHLAASHQDANIAQILLERSTVDLGALDANGRTVLHTLAAVVDLRGQRKRAEVAKMLVERGIDIDRRDMDGHTAVCHAVVRGAYLVATQLLESGANPTLGTVSPSGDYTWTLIHECFSPNRRESPWHEARMELVEMIIQCDPESVHKESVVKDARLRRIKNAPFDGTPLLFAVLYDGNLDMIQILIDNGAKVDSVATSRRINDTGSRYSIIQALLSYEMTLKFPVYSDNWAGRGKEVPPLTDDLRERLVVLLGNGARIDPEHGQQSVLEFACELQMAGNSQLLGHLFDLAKLKNVNLEHVQYLIGKYSSEGAEDAMSSELAAELQEWMDVRLLPELET
ncbi:ankyrin repeat protein [Pochonia chlamydosporia 170]|uniref:Ankyrin repeat protein n=1 Tax=Pochonia chlamydosporia 170 TaxID=1380566 RepID=A0A179FX22_METCM|nr:ankyrin repeat protein [Pochonia chlamydosporia 170]OAQ70184.1 ankyrin repeat protein [Pochonia chlamydosporia 170]